MVEATSAACLLFIWAAELFAVGARGDEPLAMRDIEFSLAHPRCSDPLSGIWQHLDAHAEVTTVNILFDRPTGEPGVSWLRTRQAIVAGIMIAASDHCPQPHSRIRSRQFRVSVVNVKIIFYLLFYTSY